MVRIGTTDVSPEVEAPTILNIKVCASQDSPVGEGVTQAFSCGQIGRYLVVLLEKTPGILSLCEVGVFAEGIVILTVDTVVMIHFVRFCIHHTFRLTD